MFLFNDGLSLMISRLSLISNKYFLFSWAKTLKLSKEGKKLQWSKWSQMALLFDGLTFFPVRGDTPICSPDLISKCLILNTHHKSLILTIIGLIAETTQKFVNINRYKGFGFRVFVTEKIGKPCLTFRSNS